MQMAAISSDIFDSKRISKTLVEQAEEDLRCPESRQYVSMKGVIKVKSKVQTQW